jgi:hypothetical protein
MAKTLNFSADDIIRDLDNATCDKPMVTFNRCYYAGGTLCMDHDDCLLLLNLTGSITYEFLNKDAASIKMMMTKDLRRAVRHTYVCVKGETQYYKETVKD